MTVSTTIIIAALLQRRRRRETLTLKDYLRAEGRRRRDRRVPRAALQAPFMSAYATLFGSGSDQALITMTGIDQRAFRYLLPRFNTDYIRFSPYGKDCRIVLRTANQGRPRTLGADACLGLVLSWYRTRGSCFVLCILFGITASVCHLFLRFGRRILVRILKKDSLARVTPPDDEEVKFLQRIIAEKYPLLSDVYAVADGLKLLLQQSGDSVIQNMFYNGWTHDHYVSNIFVFAPNGLIIFYAINAPGSMHDSQICDWGGLYDKMEEVFQKCGGRVVVDSAFCKNSYPYLIKSAQDETGCEGFEAVTRNRQATSLRQSAESGMRALQGSFTRFKDRFYYEQLGERKIILNAAALLFNYRTRLVGLNQLQSTFMPHLSVEANLFLRSLNIA